MSEPEPVLPAILLATVQRDNMLAPGQTVVVGVSGGPDSVALLHVLAHLRDEWRLSLVACHVNHGFRGAEADEDAEYVRALCGGLNVPCRTESVDVPALQKRRHLSAQQAAREVRHACLRRVAAEAGAERIALAHTRDDRTETVLLNIVRGSGLEGLAGFPPVALPLIRPLYDVTRLQVEQYCRHFNLEPRHDSSNAKLTYRRNRVRAELLPQLRTYYNLKADEALLRLADLAFEDNALLDALAAQALADVTCNDLCLPASSNASNTLRLSGEKLRLLPKALQRRALRQAIMQMRGDLQNVTFEAVEAILELAASGREGTRELPVGSGGTLRVHCDETNIDFMRVPPPAQAVPWERSVLVPGRTVVPGRSVVVITRTCLPDELPDALEDLRHAWQRETQAGAASDIGNNWRGQIVLWQRTRVQLALTVRSWQPGDRIRPRGLNGTKKIQDLFTDLKIPASERSHIPLLTEENKGRILAVGEWRAEETALLACRLSCEDAALDAAFLQAFANAQGKVGADAEARELLAVLFLYQ